jgi:hypothetical protein
MPWRAVTPRSGPCGRAWIQAQPGPPLQPPGGACAKKKKHKNKTKQNNFTSHMLFLGWPEPNKVKEKRDVFLLLTHTVARSTTTYTTQ